MKVAIQYSSEPFPSELLHKVHLNRGKAATTDLRINLYSISM